MLRICVSVVCHLFAVTYKNHETFSRSRVTLYRIVVSMRGSRYDSYANVNKSINEQEQIVTRMAIGPKELKPLNQQ